MRRIIEAHQRNQPEIISLPGDEIAYAPSPVEIEVFEPYGIVPQRMSDWTTHSITDEESIYKAVRVFENYVYVCDPSTGWAGAEPWDRFVANLGGQIEKREEEESELLVVDIRCSAPDADIAQSIYQQLKLDFDVQPVPWLAYAYDNDNEAKELKALEEKYLIWWRWDKERQRLNRLLDETPKRERDALREMVAQHAREKPFEMEDETRLKILNLRSPLQFDDHLVTISIGGEGQIYCRNLVFAHSSYGLAIPTIVSWMRDQGCEVSYQFRRTRFRRETTIKCRAIDEITANEIAEKLRARQVDQPHLPNDSETHYLLTSRDRFSTSFDEIAITLYDGNKHYVHSFLRQNRCRGIKVETKYFEIAQDEP